MKIIDHADSIVELFDKNFVKSIDAMYDVINDWKVNFGFFSEMTLLDIPEM